MPADPAVNHTILYGVPSRGEAWRPRISARGVRVTRNGTRVELEPSPRFPTLPREVAIRAIGEVFAENALAALGGSARCVRAPAVQALSLVTPPPGRFQLVREKPDVVVDYAHTPDALERTITTARQICGGRVVLVFGAGGQRDRAKRPLLGVAARAADRVVLTSDNPRGEDPLLIMQEIAAGLAAHADVVRERDRALAIRLAIASAAEDDLVLIAGKGHEQTQQEGGAIKVFSDVAVVQGSGTRARCEPTIRAISRRPTSA